MEARIAPQSGNNLPVGERVYRLIRKAILDLSLPPSARIGENGLAEDIGVSRTPVREALQRLERDGLVLVFPQRGSFVAPLDLQAVRSAFFIRLSLECAVAKEAVGRFATSDGAELERQLEAQAATVTAGDTAGFFELNSLFHRSLMLIADLEGVWSVVENAKIHLDRVRVAHMSFADPYPLAPLVAQHREIVAAIASGHAGRAEKAMREHIMPLLPRLDLLKAQRPDLFELPGDLSQPLELRPRKVVRRGKAKA